MKLIPAKSILSKTKNDHWFGTDYNMNLYRGCNHGCIYCDSRSECYRIDDFSSVSLKKDAHFILERELRSKRMRGVVGTGSMSDPYNPHERQTKATMKALMLLDKYRFGVSIATKGYLVVRDLDVLKSISSHSPVLVKITVTTSDDALAKIIEPGAPSSSERLSAIEKLSVAGIYCGILLMPVLPFITDNEQNIVSLVNSAADAGAKFIYPAFGMTLRDRQRDYYYDKLDKYFPGLSEKYRKSFGNNYSCSAKNVKDLYSSFVSECADREILYKMPDIISSYKTARPSDQFSLFD